MKNYESHSVSLKQVLSSAAFVKGFSDYKNRAGWREPDNAIEQWRYERGRLFAAWLESCGVELHTFKFKSGRWATNFAVATYKRARDCGAVI